MEKVIVITGPTASGKTDLAIALAKKIDGQIINADSMQIYKGFDIGTAKPTLEERKDIVHYMMDFVESCESYCVADYKKDATACIKEILKLGKVPIIVGGTGLYIEALIKNIDFSVSVKNSDIRKELTVFLQENGEEALYKRLKNRDPELAESIHMNNTRRVIRYLEILENFEGSFEEYKEKTLQKPEFSYKTYILFPKREVVYKRIEKRVEEMINNGLIDEVRALIKSGVKRDCQSMSAIGYKETVLYIDGKIGYNEFVELLKRNTRRYAKRQFTWFKRFENAENIEINTELDLEKSLLKIVAEYKN